MCEHEMVVFDALSAPEDSAAWKKPFLKRMHLNNGYWIGDVLVGKYAIWDVEHTDQPASCLDTRNKKCIKEH